MLGLLVVGGILLPLILAARYLMQSTRFAGPNAVMAETMEIFYRCAHQLRLRLQQLPPCSLWRAKGTEMGRLGVQCMCSPHSRCSMQSAAASLCHLLYCLLVLPEQYTGPSHYADMNSWHLVAKARVWLACQPSP